MTPSDVAVRLFGPACGVAGLWRSIARTFQRRRDDLLPDRHAAAEATPARPRRAAAPPDAAAERFAHMMLPHLDAAHNLARYMSRDAGAAEDIVQEAFLRAFRGFADFRGGSPRAWLLAIVRNCHADWRRERGQTARRLPADTTDAGLALDEVPDSADTPEAALLRQAEAAQVRLVLDALPVEFREVLVLRELEDCTYREIAEVASVPIGTVMSRLARARRMFAVQWHRLYARPETER